METKLAQEFLSDMIRVRRMEEKCAELYSAAKIRGFLHLYVGEEAVAFRISARRPRLNDVGPFQGGLSADALRGWHQ